ncbi:MAG TPA: hypothetical protein VF584_18680 [Longimicrobium sp.]|jgi:hypothetical protein
MYTWKVVLRGAALLVLLAVCTHPAGAQNRGSDAVQQSQPSNRLKRYRAPARSDTIKYRWSTGALTGEPAVAGRTARIRLLDENPLCYSYAYEARPHLASVDIARLLTGLGTIPGAAAAATTTQAAAAGTADSAALGTNWLNSGRELQNLVESASGMTVDAARSKVTEAITAVDLVRSTVASLEATLALIEKPTCDGTVPASAVVAEWDETSNLSGLAGNVSTAVLALDIARAAVLSVEDDGVDATSLATLVGLGTSLQSARTSLDSLERARPELVRRMARADAIVRALAERTDNAFLEPFVPQGTDTLYLVLTRRELHPADGKPANPTVQTIPLPVRNGMRFFLSAGALASGLRARDYQRVTRAYADTTRGVYSTYANVSRGNTFGFSPVLQGNVAFRDVRGGGVSFLGSTGIAVRSVNGSNSPEFLLGAGLGFLDRMVFTAGVHMGRRERLLLGNPTEVAGGPVSDKVTDDSAIGVEWKPAFMTAFSIRLTN